MGQIFSWFRGSPSRDEPALRDVSVEESQSGTTPKPAAPVSHFEQQKSSAGSNMASKTTAAGSDVTATGSAPKSGAAAQVKTSASKLDPKASTKTTTVKVEPAKVTKPSTAAPTAKASAPRAQQTEVQVEVPPKAKKPAPAPPLDPLDALASSLPSEAPKRPEPKYTGPEVKEGVTSEEGVRVGEREDTLPPGYRLEDMAPVPADAKPAEVPKPMSSDEALDVLSFAFAAEVPQRNVETVSAASRAPANFAPAPPADKKPKLDTAADSFCLSAAVPTKAPTSSKPQASSVTPPTSDMSFDALSALEDLLPSAEPPKPEAPLRPEDLVSEATVTEEEGVRVGEREDTLPPEYRLKPEELSSRSSKPSPQPSLNTADALDILSGDFSSSSAPSTHSAAPAQSAADAALEALSGDFIAPSAAPTVQSSACPPQAPLSADADFALDALSDSLKDIAPTPQPEPPMPKNIVTEKKVEEERLIKMGERDDTLPPEYRPTEEDLKKMSEEKNKVPKEKPMDDKTALDILSGDFSAPAPVAPAASAPVSSSASAPVCSAPTNANKPMPGKVLDSLYETLLPETAEPKKTEKAKKSPAEGAVELPSSQRGSDVVPTSTKKS